METHIMEKNTRLRRDVTMLDIDQRIISGALKLWGRNWYEGVRNSLVFDKNHTVPYIRMRAPNEMSYDINEFGEIGDLSAKTVS